MLTTDQAQLPNGGDNVDVEVPYGKGKVKDAPRISDANSHLSEEDESELYVYYGIGESDTSYAQSSDSVTDNVTTTMPVSHEEVRLEREPITDANRGVALSSGEHGRG